MENLGLCPKFHSQVEYFSSLSFWILSTSSGVKLVTFISPPATDSITRFLNSSTSIGSLRYSLIFVTLDATDLTLFPENLISLGLSAPVISAFLEENNNVP